MDAKTEARYRKIQEAQYDNEYDRFGDQLMVASDNMIAQCLRNMIAGRGKGFAAYDMIEAQAALEEYVAFRAGPSRPRLKQNGDRNV
jgi:hypothetical protein